MFFIGRHLGSAAKAQGEPRIGSDGEVMVVPVQIGRDSYGLAMVDTAAQTLWIYELNNRGPAYNRLKLLAARSWQYDRMLKRYNTAEPYPEQVRLLLENVGQSGRQQDSRKRRDSSKSVSEKVTPGRTDSVLGR